MAVSPKESMLQKVGCLSFSLSSTDLRDLKVFLREVSSTSGELDVMSSVS